MYNYLGILSSDTLNRDGYLILFDVLEKSIADNALKGMPSLIDHDFHRPLGWIFPFGILIEPKISKTIGNFIICEDEADSELIDPKIQNYWQYLNYENCKDFIDEFKELLQENYSPKGHFLKKGCVAYNLSNVTEKIFPKLFSNLDKSGLIYLDEILEEFEYKGSGIFQNKNNPYSIFCHQYFNRNLSIVNNYNTYFIDEFVRFYFKNKNVRLRIAIDRNLIGLSKTYTGTLEFDYWWGPKFNDDISKIPDQVTRYESSEREKFFSNVSGTEFWWKKDENEKTLEIEEIRESPSLGLDQNSYGCRYIHSIYDVSRTEFFHFDGAVRVYTEEQIMDRWDIDIKKSGKNTAYTKLFRIDGKLELADWKKLCVLYYKGNSTLFEYFGAKEEYEKVNNDSKSSDVLSEYLPNKITTEDGIRLFVSYHKKNHNYKSFDRKVINPDTIRFEDEEVLSVLEYDIIEIEKYLKRVGHNLDYPKDIRFVKPFDFYSNYPIILHGSNETDDLLLKTKDAFQTIFTIQNETLNKTISFTLGWEMEKFEVRLSVFGKSSEIVKWLKTISDIPVEYEKFRNWLVQQKSWIYDHYNYSGKDFSHLLKDDGIFYFKRTTVNNDIISFPNPEDNSFFTLNIEDKSTLDILVKEKKIFPTHLGLLKKVICSKTGENYFTSETSKYLDKEVYMAIENIELLGMFWTDELDEKHIRIQH